MTLPGRRMKLPEEEMNLPIPAKPLVRDFTDEEIDYLFQYHPPSPDQREVSEFRLTGRDSLCPDGAAFVSTIPPSPSGDSKGLAAK